MHVQSWSETEWLARGTECDALLVRSSADPLFLSWDWQSLCWQELSGLRPHDELRVYAARENSVLVGTLALVIGEVRRRGGLRYRAATVLGGGAGVGGGIFSEYIDAVAVAGRESEVRAACLEEAMRQVRCGEFAIGATAAASDWEALFHQRRRSMWSYVRKVDPLTSYQADLSGGFARYLEALSGNARRSLFNQRNKLERLGRVEVFQVPPDDVSAAIDEMNRLHALRWATAALQGPTARVHEELIRRWSGRDRIRVSRLRLAGCTVSVLYDIRIGATQYNIQMGFDPAIDSSLSLGLLHLGYAMEQAAQEGVATYDFLAGTGRATDYKKRIASRSCELASIQYLCTPGLALAYRGYDGLRRWQRVRRVSVPVADGGAG